jgi:hypothetical protein
VDADEIIVAGATWDALGPLGGLGIGVDERRRLGKFGNVWWAEDGRET